MHHSVMLEEALALLAIRPDGIYVDGTAGAGGHTRGMLSQLGADGRVFAVDCDPTALARLAGDAGVGGDARCTLMQGNFESIGTMMKNEAGVEKVNGILMDLGYSSNQLDDPQRGFSFSKDGPLDMRLDPNAPRNAADIVNTADVDTLKYIFKTYGEEHRAHVIASAIVRERASATITTTGQLAELVSRVVGRGKRNHHPATRMFQALRIAVNDELGVLERGLDSALSVLEEGGRLVVISFHSLEDRIVKQFMRRHEGVWESLHAGGSVWRGEHPRMKRITKKPQLPAAAEIARNPRSRSAKCRAAERIGDTGTDD